MKKKCRGVVRGDTVFVVGNEMAGRWLKDEWTRRADERRTR